MLAVRFNWKPDEVARMDPEFIEELSSYLRAEAKYQEYEAKKAKGRGDSE